MAVDDTYSLLKSTHAGQHFTCCRKKGSNSLTTPIRIVLALASHASLITHFAYVLFAPVPSNSRSTVLQVTALALHLCMYIHASQLHKQADSTSGNILNVYIHVHKMKWNRTDTTRA